MSIGTFLVFKPTDGLWDEIENDYGELACNASWLGSQFIIHSLCKEHKVMITSNHIAYVDEYIEPSIIKMTYADVEAFVYIDKTAIDAEWQKLYDHNHLHFNHPPNGRYYRKAINRTKHQFKKRVEDFDMIVCGNATLRKKPVPPKRYKIEWTSYYRSRICLCKE